MIDMARRIENLPQVQVQDRAADEYYACRDELQEFVMESAMEKENIDELIGYNSPELLADYHQQHMLLMSNVFKLNEHRLLRDAIPGLYSTYVSRGFSYEYFLEELPCWIRGINKYISEGYRLTLIEIYRWLEDNHENFVEVTEEEKKLTLEMKNEWHPVYDEFLDAILLKDSKECHDIIERNITGSEDFRKAARNVIMPALYTIGYMWQQGNITVAEEHRATSIASRILSSYYMEYLPESHTRGRAVISAVANEQHEIGARMVADFLEFEGWDVSFLGADTARRELLQMVEAERPFFLGLSVSLPQNMISLKKTVESVRARDSISDIRILSGGKVLNDFPYLKEELAVDGYARDCEEAVKIANNWWDD